MLDEIILFLLVVEKYSYQLKITVSFGNSAATSLKRSFDTVNKKKALAMFLSSFFMTDVVENWAA